MLAVAGEHGQVGAVLQGPAADLRRSAPLNEFRPNVDVAVACQRDQRLQIRARFALSDAPVERIGWSRCPRSIRFRGRGARSAAPRTPRHTMVAWSTTACPSRNRRHTPQCAETARAMGFPAVGARLAQACRRAFHFCLGGAPDLSKRIVGRGRPWTFRHPCDPVAVVLVLLMDRAPTRAGTPGRNRRAEHGCRGGAFRPPPRRQDTGLLAGSCGS